MTQKSLKKIGEEFPGLDQELIKMRDKEISDLTQNTGIDVGNKAAVIDALRSLRDNGDSINLSIQEFEEHIKNHKNKQENI